jgi:hypothetical protein
MLTIRSAKVLLNLIAMAVKDEVIEEDTAISLVDYVWTKLGEVIPSWNVPAGSEYLKKQIERARGQARIVSK